MGAKVSAETVKALRLYDNGLTVGEASRKAGIETSTLRRALAKREAGATVLDAVAVLSSNSLRNPPTEGMPQTAYCDGKDAPK